MSAEQIQKLTKYRYQIGRSMIWEIYIEDQEYWDNLILAMFLKSENVAA